MRKEINQELKVLRKENITPGFRIIICGKGGAGKTTLTTLLSMFFIEQGYRVLAVDEDPQMNLPYALGYPPEEAKNLLPLSKNFDYIEEKIGARPGNWGCFLRLNPPVGDVIDKFGLKLGNELSCLVMGTVNQPATGCLCPENALLDAVIKHVSLRQDEMILLDTQAGIEHFGRALAKGFSQCLVITDQTYNSMSVAMHAADLAKEIGIPHIHLVFNQINNEEMRQKAIQRLSQFGKNERNFASVSVLPREEYLLEFEPNISKFYTKCHNSSLARAVTQIGHNLLA